ncbi:TPA: NYN domain-containing protein, partial [Neisseria gonorrhoeae]
SREMWRDLRENQITVSKSLEDITETKPRTRIPLSEDILAEFEKIRRGNHKKD